MSSHETRSEKTPISCRKLFGSSSLLRLALYHIKASSERHYYSSAGSCASSVNTNVVLCWRPQTVLDMRPLTWRCPPARWSSSLMPAVTAAVAGRRFLSQLSPISHETGTDRVWSVFCRDTAHQDSGETTSQRPWKWVLWMFKYKHE